MYVLRNKTPAVIVNAKTCTGVITTRVYTLHVRYGIQSDRFGFKNIKPIMYNVTPMSAVASACVYGYRGRAQTLFHRDRFFALQTTIIL